MRIVVVGSSGQVAECLRQQLPQAAFLNRAELDLSNLSAIEPKLQELAPQFLVNAAAFTAVDQAEADYEEALTVNGLAVERMAGFCADAGIPMVHLSTDYVFPGNATRPYLETDATDPINAYGRSKLAGEVAVLSETKLYGLVLRTSWVFSEFGNNFVKTMLRLGAERDQLGVVNDQQGRPTYAGDIASAITRIIQRYKSSNPVAAGLYHCASQGITTWYEFAAEIFRQARASELLGNTPELSPITTSEFPTPAPRPAFSVLDTTKLDDELNWSAPDWQEGLATVLQRL